MSNKVILTNSRIPHYQRDTAHETFLERMTDISLTALSYLELQDIRIVGACSTRFNMQANAPRLWQDVSKTFALPDVYWNNRTKARVKENLGLLKRVNATFAFCCAQDNPKGPNGMRLRDQVLRFASMQPAQLDLALPGNARRSFVERVRPVVSKMCEAGEALHALLLCDIDSSSRFLEMFYACGNRGTEKTLNYFSGYPLYLSQMQQSSTLMAPHLMCTLFPSLIHNHTDLEKIAEYAEESDATLSLDAARQLVRYGETPETFAPLLVEYDLRPSKELGEIIHELMSKNVKSPPTLRDVLLFGPLELVELFLTTANVVVAPSDLSLFLCMIFHRREVMREHSVFPVTAAYVIDVIDLMLEKQGKPTDYGLEGEPSFDNFGGLAVSFPDENLLRKLLAIGIKPENERDNARNSIAFALCQEAPESTIGLMCKFGALAPTYALDCIKENYSNPSVKEALYTLLGIQHQALTL